MLQNVPFTISADHSGENTEKYVLYMNEQVVQEKPVSALQNGTITFADADGLPKGSYVVRIDAVNADGAAPSEDLLLTITGVAPARPLNIRVGVL